MLRISSIILDQFQNLRISKLYAYLNFQGREKKRFFEKKNSLLSIMKSDQNQLGENLPLGAKRKVFESSRYPKY